MEEIAPLAWFAAQAQIAPVLMKSKYGSSRENDELRRLAIERINQLLSLSKADNSSLKSKLPAVRGNMNQWFAEQPSRALHLQAELSKLLTEQRMQALGNSPIDKERIASNSSPESSRFHTTLPLTKQTTIEDSAYILMLRHKMGVKATEQPLPDNCRLCQREITDSVEDTWHPLFCKSLVPTEMNQKHNAVVRTVASAIESAGGTAEIEVKKPCTFDDKLRIDIRGTLGLMKRALVDVTCRSFKAPSRRDHPERMIDDAERDKAKKYEAFAKEEQGEVFPFVLNELGKLGPRANELMALVWKHAESSGMTPVQVHKLRNEFYSTLSCINASSSMKSVATHLSRLCYDKWKQQQQEAKSERLELGWLDELKSAPMKDHQRLQQERKDENSIPMNVATQQNQQGQFVHSADSALPAASDSSSSALAMDDDETMSDAVANSTGSTDRTSLKTLGARTPASLMDIDSEAGASSAPLAGQAVDMSCS
jgi:hypothetical protein